MRTNSIDSHSSVTGENSGDLMFITPSRIVVKGQMGEPASRVFGALTFYVSEEEPINLSIKGGGSESVEFAVVPPNTRHLAYTESGHLTKVLVESETIDIPRVIECYTGSEIIQRETADRMRKCFKNLSKAVLEDGEIDTLFFGQPLASRSLDSRIQTVVDDLVEDSVDSLTAKDCADRVGLSYDRFVHLFREQVGYTFRLFRAWKRARSFMPFANENCNLADVAQHIGYSDGPHFSRSIRQVYGISPRQINETASDFNVVSTSDRDIPLR